MSTRWFLVRAVVAVVVIGLLVMGGLAIHRMGWSQGYRMGQLAVEGEDIATAPHTYYGFGYGGRPFGFGPFLCGAGLLFLLFVAVGQIFRLLAWKKVMGRGPWPMATRWHGMHGPMPPWCWYWEKPSEEKTEKAEPDAETGDAEPES